MRERRADALAGRRSGARRRPAPPVILGRGPDPGDTLIDTAGELRVHHVLVGSGPADRSTVVARFAELCERAAPHGITVVLEFPPIFIIGSLAAARSVVEEWPIRTAPYWSTRCTCPGRAARLPT